MLEYISPCLHIVHVSDPRSNAVQDRAGHFLHSVEPGLFEKKLGSQREQSPIN